MTFHQRKANKKTVIAQNPQDYELSLGSSYLNVKVKFQLWQKRWR